MSESKSLHALVQTAASIEDLLIANHGEMTPEIESALAITEISLPEKIDNYDLLMDRMDSVSTFYKSKADFYLRLAKAANNVIDRCEDNLKLAMGTFGIDEIKGHDVKFRLQNSNPACVIEDEAKIDGAYKITETITRVDKKRVTEDLKMGVPVAGARLEVGKSLRRYANSPAKGGRK